VKEKGEYYFCGELEDGTPAVLHVPDVDSSIHYVMMLQPAHFLLTVTSKTLL
jgi:hypothetical protein